MKPRLLGIRFTLLEGVVIILLAIGAAFLAVEWSTRSAYVNSAFGARLGMMRGVYGAMLSYSNDHGGEFPTGATSNEALRKLFPDYLDQEKAFAPVGWMWGPSASPPPPDGKIGTAPTFSDALTKGECSYGCVSGLRVTDGTRFPILSDAFAGTPGVYDVARMTRLFSKPRLMVALVTLDGATEPYPVDPATGRVIFARVGGPIDPFDAKNRPPAAKVLDAEW